MSDLARGENEGMRSVLITCCVFSGTASHLREIENMMKKKDGKSMLATEYILAIDAAIIWHTCVRATSEQTTNLAFLYNQQLKRQSADCLPLTRQVSYYSVQMSFCMHRERPHFL